MVQARGALDEHGRIAFLPDRNACSAAGNLVPLKPKDVRSYDQSSLYYMLGQRAVAEPTAKPAIIYTVKATWMPSVNTPVVLPVCAPPQIAPKNGTIDTSIDCDSDCMDCCEPTDDNTLCKESCIDDQEWDLRACVVENGHQSCVNL